MIYKSTRIIKKVLDDNNIKNHMYEFGVSSVIAVDCRIKDDLTVRVQFISKSKDNEVRIMIPYLIRMIPEDKEAEVLKLINACNRKYKFVKFYLDKNRNLQLEYILPQTTQDNSVGAEAVEIYIRMVRTVAYEYPTFMNVIRNRQRLDP